MRPCLKWTLLAAAALLCGCPGSASVVATVTVPAGMKCTCVRVMAVTEDGAELSSQPLPRPPSGELRVAIFEPQGQARPVTLVARGYVGTGCAEPLLLNEESVPVAAAFQLGTGGAAALALQPPPAAVDVDGDLFRSARAGGPDCDDLRGSANPAAAEGCGNGADDDCDSKVDCGDDTCLGAACGDGRACTPLGTCEGRESACTDGADNDLDGLTDCQDQDCTGASCDDRNPCTRQDVCSAGACTGTAVACDAPPSAACMVASGTCNPSDGGCWYPAAVGRTCAAGVCQHDAGCGPLFPYTPSNFTPPDAGEFVPLAVDCGSVGLNTDNVTSPWSLPGACGPRAMPPLIIRTQTGANDAVVIPVDSLTIASGSEVLVSGSRPAIFAVFGDAVLDGRIRMLPAASGSNGAGVSVSCAGGQGLAGGSGGTSAAGGGGGGLGGAGAMGGNGVGTTGGVFGNIAANPLLVPLAGGCAGGNGGTLNSNQGGTGGGGGGALQLSASGSVIIRSGGLGAPGGRGRGGQQHQTGAGGGGSGGAVLVEGQSLRISLGGYLTANGAGGGAGDSCCSPGLADGQDGADGNPSSPNQANGGNRQFSGGRGGVGGPGGAAAGAPGTGGAGSSWNNGGGTTYNGGGGGGGGGVGRIRINVSADCALDGGFLSGAATSNKAGSNGCP